MKNIHKHFICTAILILSISFCFFPVNVFADTQRSVIAQMNFKDKVLELLKQNDLDALKEYIDSIPNCNYSAKAVKEEVVSEEGTEETPIQEPAAQVNPANEICTVDRTNGKSFLWHVWQKGANKERLRFTLVEIDAGLYDSLGNLYRYLYNANSRQFDARLYRDFYNRFKNTWLKEKIELILTNLWQDGTIYRKWDGFSAMTGKNIYTTLYVSYMVGIPLTKYIDPEIKLDKYVYGGGRDRLRVILKEMKQKNDETNTPQLLRYIKRLWYHSIAYNESDQEEKDYYQGRKHKKMYELLSEGGWDMFSDILDGLSGETLRLEKHNIKVDIWNCERITGKKELCDSFEQGAIKNGFYTAPIEYIEPSIEEKMQELQDQIDEKLFMYK